MRCSRQRILVSVLVFSSLGGPQAAGGQVTPATTLSRIGDGFVLDGTSDEAAWSAVRPFPTTTYEPVYRADPTERSEILVAHDDDFLYVAGRMYERDSSRIRAYSLYRDRSNNDDRLGVLIDSFDDNQSGLWFWTTPAGVRGDEQITNDGRSGNGNWNTHWDVAVVRSEDGWFAEMRIPFSSLGFQPSAEGVRMGITAERWLASRNERHVFPDIPPDFDWRRPSLAHDVVLAGEVLSARPVYITPYALTGRKREAVLDSGASSYRFVRDNPLELGGDLKYPVTPNLTIDLTANTDFAQVEVDDQQVNLSRYSLFFSEKRQFFQERSDIFSFGFGDADRLFHSRRIGLAGGEPIRILGGGRVAGRIGDWDVGVLDMQTEASGGVPTVNHGVLRARRTVLNEYSTAGGIFTSQIRGDGTYNLSYGLDTSIRWRGDHYVDVRWAQTFDDEDDAHRQALLATGWREGLFDRSMIRLRAWKEVEQGFQYGFSGRSIGPLLNPGMGFLSRGDVTEMSGEVAWSKIFGAGTALREIAPFQIEGEIAFRNGDRSVERASVQYNMDLGWKNDWGLWWDPIEMLYDGLDEPVDLPENSFVPAGQYTYFKTEGGVETPSGRVLRGGIDGGVQSFFDGMRYNVGAEMTWNASAHLSLSGSYGLSAVRFDSRDQEFASNIARLRIQSALDTRLSLNAFLQWASANDAFAANVRLRYNLSEGTDLWVVYDEGLQLDRDVMSPRPPLSTRRTLLIKYSHTFR